MKKTTNLTDHVFGRLIVISRQGANKYRHILWLCRCECGTEKIINGSLLRSGETKSCGCLQKDIASNINRRHMMCKSKEYKAWSGIIQRCTNVNDKSFHNYGGRGIKVCDRWMLFNNFISDMGLCGEGLTIDRIDVNDGYHKNNCRWATTNVQAFNKRKYKSSNTEKIGVSRHGNSYRASIRINGEIKSKTFKNIGDAINWRKQMELLVYGFNKP
jgi:hypothetical protein